MNSRKHLLQVELARYADGKGSHAFRVKVKKHLAKCDACRSRLVGLEKFQLSADDLLTGSAELEQAKMTLTEIEQDLTKIDRALEAVQPAGSHPSDDDYTTQASAASSHGEELG